MLITDAMMPGKDGYELSRELRAMPETASLPIIMLTALHEEQDALKAFQDGVDDFVTKTLQHGYPARPSHCPGSSGYDARFLCRITVERHWPDKRG